MNQDADFLTASDIARLRGCSRKTAWKWLRGLPESYVTRRGVNRVVVGITRAQLEAYARTKEAPIDPRIERRLADIEARLLTCELRDDVSRRDIGQLQRVVRGASVG